jgi:prolyl-tRNA editing enzyme YbaK/EbsC (Cys-tRNA(Pro) deacylase)
VDDDDAIEQAVRAAVEKLGARYEVLPCDPVLADTAAFCANYGIAAEDAANTIVVATKREPRRYAACVVLATTRLDVNGIVKRRLDGGKCSFLGAGETAALTGMQIGGVTPVGLPAAVPVWIDGAVLDRPLVVLGGGSRRMKLRLPPEALLRLPATEMVVGLASAPDSTI